VQAYDGIWLTNGLRVSPDGGRLYHADTLRRVVWVSDLVDGLPRARRVHVDLGDLLPDGMAMDETGALWVACIGGGRLVRVTPDGRRDLELELPWSHPTAACFGGSDGRDLYVTTFGGEPYDTAHTGSVVVTRVGVAGAPVTPAAI
jgi:sugar lactone lactonase YvrE